MGQPTWARGRIVALRAYLRDSIVERGEAIPWAAATRLIDGSRNRGGVSLSGRATRDPTAEGAEARRVRAISSRSSVHC